MSVCPYPEKKNHPGFVNISPTIDLISLWLLIAYPASGVVYGPTLVIDTSMERSSRVHTTAWKPINLIFFFQESSKLNFDLC